MNPSPLLVDMRILLLIISALSVITASNSTSPGNPPFHRFSLGGAKCTIVSDGVAFFDPESGPTFLVQLAAIKRNYAASFRSISPVVLQQNILIADLPAGRIMVDAGSVNIPEFPQFDSGGQLIANMRAANITPESIDAIIFTHAHADHVSGVTTKDGKRAFPNAKLYINKKEHEFWTQENVPNPKPAVIPDQIMFVLADIYRRTIAPYGERLVVVPEGGSPLPGVKFLSTPGHSPGHISVRLSSKGEHLIVTGDSWIAKPDQLENPEWEFFIESNPEQAYNSRIRILSSAARRGDLVLSYHEAFPGLGRVSVNGAAFTWNPAPLLFA